MKLKEMTNYGEMVDCVDRRVSFNHEQNIAIRKKLADSVRDLGTLMKKQTNNLETAFVDKTLGMLFSLDPTGVTGLGFDLMKAEIADIEALNYNLNVSEIINKYQYGTPTGNMSCCNHIKEAYILSKAKRELNKKLIDHSIDRLIQKYKNTKYQSEKYTKKGGLKYFKFSCEKNDKDGKKVTGTPVLLTSPNQANKKHYSGTSIQKYSCDFDQSINLKSNEANCEHGFFPRASKKHEISQESFMNVCMRRVTGNYDWRRACDYSYQILDNNEVPASAYHARKASELIYSIANVTAENKASAQRDMQNDFQADFLHAIKEDKDKESKQMIFV